MKMEGNRRYIKTAVTGIVIVSFGLLLFFALYRIDTLHGTFKQIRSILRPFLFGAVVAYLLTPMCSKIQAWLFKRTKRKKLSLAIAILLSVLFALLLISFLALIIVPQVIHSVVGIVRALPGELAGLSDQIVELLPEDEVSREWFVTFSENARKAGKSLQDNDLLQLVQGFLFGPESDSGDLLPLAQSLLYGTVSYLESFLILFKDLLLSVVLTFYLLAARKQILAQGRLLLRSFFSDIWVERIEDEIKYADKMFNGFFMGKLLDSAIMGVLCFLGCLLMGLPSALLIGTIIGITNIIPFFGPFLGAIPCTLLLLLENPIHALIFVIFILVLQQIDGNILGPKILGNTTGLSGLWVTFAILLFGGLWGIVGMIIAVPLFAVIYDVIRKICASRLRQKGHADMLDAYNKEFHPVHPPQKISGKKA